VEKIPEDANIKLSSIASDTFGASGKRIIRELMKGELQAEEMAELSKGRLRSRKAELKEALVGNMEDHHRFMIQAHLSHIAMMEDILATIEQKIQEKIEIHFKEEYELLKTIPPVKDSASVVIAEMGVNMDLFPTEMHPSSWSGMRQQRERGKEEAGSDHPREQASQDHIDRVRMGRLKDEGHVPLVEIP
jgi:transposase